MGTGKIPYSSFKVQLYFPILGLAVILKKRFPHSRLCCSWGNFFFSIPAKPLMGKYNCTFHDSQGIFISFTRRCAARKGNIPSPFFKMTGLGHSYYLIENLLVKSAEGNIQGFSYFSHQKIKN